MEGWISPGYGQRQPAPMVVYSTTAPLPLRIVTLLLPSREPNAPPPPARPLVREGTGLVGLVIDGDHEMVLEGEDGVLHRAPAGAEVT
jgi:hypothetical protein